MMTARLRYLSLIIATSFCLGNCYSSGSLTIRAELLGKSGEQLQYFDDYKVVLSAAGNQLDRENYRVLGSSSGNFKMRVFETASNDFFRLEFRFSNYVTLAINVDVSQARNGEIDLGILRPQPNPIMISRLQYLTPEDDSTQMEFKVTFQNNSLKSALLSKLEITTEVTTKCSSPSPVFARVEVAREVTYFTNEVDDNLVGKTRNSDGQKAYLKGQINYEECGTQMINLVLPIDAVVPSEAHSQMVIRIPNELAFYEVSRQRPQPVHNSDYYVGGVAPSEDPITDMASFFSFIPDINFRFHLESGGVKRELTTTLQDYYRR